MDDATAHERLMTRLQNVKRKASFSELLSTIEGRHLTQEEQRSMLSRVLSAIQSGEMNAREANALTKAITKGGTHGKSRR